MGTFARRSQRGTHDARLCLSLRTNDSFEPPFRPFFCFFLFLRLEFLPAPSSIEGGRLPAREPWRERGAQGRLGGVCDVRPAERLGRLRFERLGLGRRVAPAIQRQPERGLLQAQRRCAQTGPSKRRNESREQFASNEIAFANKRCIGELFVPRRISEVESKNRSAA